MEVGNDFATGRHLTDGSLGRFPSILSIPGLDPLGQTLMTPTVDKAFLRTSFNSSIGGATDRHCKSVMAPCNTSCCDLLFFDAFQSSTRSIKTFRCSGVQLSGIGQNTAPLSVGSSSSELELEAVELKSSPLSSASGQDMTILVADGEEAESVPLAGTTLISVQEPRCCI